MSASQQLDSQILSDAGSISSDYSDLMSLVTRQAMSAIDITVSENSDGTFNSSDIMAFMSNIGSVGTIASKEAVGVNTVDVLYASFPIFLYLNAHIGEYLLSPLLVAQSTTLYTQPYASRGFSLSLPGTIKVLIAKGLAHVAIT